MLSSAMMGFLPDPAIDDVGSDLEFLTLEAVADSGPITINVGDYEGGSVRSLSDYGGSDYGGSDDDGDTGGGGLGPPAIHVEVPSLDRSVDLDLSDDSDDVGDDDALVLEGD